MAWDCHEEPPPAACDLCGRNDVDLCPHCLICPECICLCTTPAPLCAACDRPARRCLVCCQCRRCGCCPVAHGDPPYDDDGRDYVPWEN